MDKSRIVVLLLLHLTVLVASQRIDTHTHYVPAFYKTLLESANISGGFPAPVWNASAHLALNAQLGIQTSIVSISTPGVTFTKDAPIEQGRSIARQVNEFGKNLTTEYPKNFLFFASLTLPDLEGATAEAVYALDTLGAAGVVVYASQFGELFGTPRYAPLYKLLNDRETVVFIHPSNSPCAQPTAETANSTDIPTYVVDFLLDTTRAALNLVYRNVTTNYPNIKFILAHSGGFLPFGGVRAASILGLSPAGQTAFLNLERTKFHADLAISANSFTLPSTLAFFNKTQLTFGTDYPYAPLAIVQENLGSYLGYPLGNGTRRRFDYSNAYQLFKKFLK